MKSTGSVTSFLGGTNGSGIILRTVTSSLTLSSLSMSLIEVMCLVACVFGGSFWDPLAGPFWPRFTGSFVDLAEAEEKCEFGGRHNFVQRQVLRKRAGLMSFTAAKDILTAVKSICTLHSSLFEAH